MSRDFVIGYWRVLWASISLAGSLLCVFLGRAAFAADMSRLSNTVGAFAFVGCAIVLVVNVFAAYGGRRMRQVAMCCNIIGLSGGLILFVAPVVAALSYNPWDGLLLGAVSILQTLIQSSLKESRP